MGVLGAEGANLNKVRSKVDQDRERFGSGGTNQVQPIIIHHNIDYYYYW